MAGEEGRCNGVVDPGELGADGFITYRRKKRARAAGDESVMEPHGGAFEHVVFPRVDSHWRNTLEYMLHLPGVGEGGVQSCIRNALQSCPLGFTRKSKMVEVSNSAAQPEGRDKGNCEIEGQSQMKDVSSNFTADGSNIKLDNQSDVKVNTAKCQKVLLEIFCSESFASLCHLFCESFESKTVRKLLDFSLINSKMKNGVYEQLPIAFNEDIQQLWNKFQKIGQDILLISSGLSKMSMASYGKQVVEELGFEAGEEKFEKNPQGGAVLRDSMNFYVTGQFPLCESGWSNKSDKNGGSCMGKVYACKQCGIETVGEHRLICDECEAIYHFSCVEPTVLEILPRNWYCASCRRDKSESPGPVIECETDGLHKNCAVCDRLEFSEAEKNIPNESTESSVSCMESDGPPEPSRTAIAHLCKLCGTCEDEDRRFLTCGNHYCPYKYYHIRCLRNNQIASEHQKNRHCWYCPSCLCRACYLDQDDDEIVLCDGCDDAYHTYCMKPPRTSVPKGQWYCVQCNLTRAKEGMRRYEQWILQQHSRKDVLQVVEENRPLDMLLDAVEKLSSEDQRA